MRTRLTGSAATHSREELDRLRDEAGAYVEFRHRIEGDINQAPYAVFMGTKEQKALLEMTPESMRLKLQKKPEIAAALTPTWPVGCRRLTLGPGYLEGASRTMWIILRLESGGFFLAALKRRTARFGTWILLSLRLDSTCRSYQLLS